MGVQRSGGWPILLWAFSQVLAFGQEPRFQFDPVEDYSSKFLTGVLILGIALLLFNLIRYRGRILGSVSVALLVAGIVVIPLGSVLLGTLLVFQRAERVDFCLSCHLTMKPYVDDLRNPKSTSLAALHYQNRYIPANQCYECHTSYGMFGTVEAKEAGLIDVYKYFTMTFHLPIRMREPYPNTDCLKCHAESVKWAAFHQDFKEALFAGEMKCMQCHRDTNPAHTLQH
jgi:cytochrome c nitrite reductase small subunit